MEQVKKIDNITSDADGFRMMAAYANKGRNSIDLNIWNRMPMKKSLKKRGTLSEVFFIIIVIFMLSAGGLFGYYLFSQMTDKIVDVPAINESVKARAAFEETYDVINKFDYVFFFAFIAMILGMWIASWFVAGNPIYVWMYFIGLGLAILVAAILSNVWDSLFIAKLLSLKGVFPLLDNIWNNIVSYLTISGLVSMIIMYSKGRFE